ncbi:hypothetical protein [uncultured Clostridium sp.]|uniref:hypothetical protein n=1 Tax=uncultured Clostridium sp. TaxID=59620 RepID=UPI00263991F0|nr:hypothetical protein [uncultured Clostridium sp.]
MENLEELKEKFYERENKRKLELLRTLDLEPLFNWLRAVTGIVELEFEVEKDEKDFEIEFKSQNIVEYSGIMQLNFTGLYIEDFGSGINSTKPRYYDNEEIDYTKDYDIYYWASIHFNYEHIDGGTNGAKLGSAIYKNGKWEFSLEKDRKR